MLRFLGAADCQSADYSGQTVPACSGVAMRHIWKTTGLKKQFASTQDILDEMRSIRCIEHNGRAKFITPFVGAQKDICKAFGFDIPEGCGTEYKSRKVSPKRRGRPAEAKTVKLDS